MLAYVRNNGIPRLLIAPVNDMYPSEVIHSIPNANSISTLFRFDLQKVDFVIVLQCHVLSTFLAASPAFAQRAILGANATLTGKNVMRTSNIQVWELIHMPNAAPNPQSDADQLDAAADQAIAACGGDAREAVKALIVANEFLERELETKVSQGYMRGVKHGRSKTYSG